MSTQKFATEALHAGNDVSVTGGTRTVPIYQTTSYVFDDADHAANVFNLSEPGFINPASTTHQQLNTSQQKSTGVTQDLIRLSVSLEDIEDLKTDIENALTKIKTITK